MEDQSLSELLKLAELLEEETLKYTDGNSTKEQIIKILVKIKVVITTLSKVEKTHFNFTKIKESMDITSKIIIIVYEVLKHFIDH